MRAQRSGGLGTDVVDDEVLGLVVDVVQRAAVEHVEDEARQAHECLAAACRRGDGAAVAGKACRRTMPSRMLRVGCRRLNVPMTISSASNSASNAVHAVQLGLGRVLRDLPADAALGAHLPAVEAFDRARVGAARLVAASEQRDRFPAVASPNRSARSRSTPAAPPRSGSRDCPPAGRPRVAWPRRARSRKRTRVAGCCSSSSISRSRVATSRWSGNAHDEVAGGLRFGQVGAIAGRAGLDLDQRTIGRNEAPAQILQQQLLAIRRGERIGDGDSTHQQQRGRCCEQARWNESREVAVHLPAR